jgi:hypothetical protein
MDDALTLLNNLAVSQHPVVDNVHLPASTLADYLPQYILVLEFGQLTTRFHHIAEKEWTQMQIDYDIVSNSGK